MTFSISCKNQKLICNEIRKNEVAPSVLYDVSFVYSRCRARCFDANKWETLPLSSCPKLAPPDYESYKVEYNSEELSKMGLKGNPEVINLDLEDCEGVSGFKIEDMAREFRPKVKSLSDLKRDYCGN